MATWNALRELGKEYAAEVDYKRADIDFSSQAAKLKDRAPRP